MNMNQALEKLINEIVNDFELWQNAGLRLTASGEPARTEIQGQMLDEFIKGIRVEEGRKYIKIIKSNSVWGFIVAKDDAKFKVGDILKAASYNAPARNKARGNIFDESYSINWTGPHYLK